MQILQFVVVGFFILDISLKDLKTHRIANRTLLYFLCSRIIFSVLLPDAQMDAFAGLYFFAIFTVLYLVSNAVHKSGGIGFGDVKLIGALAFAFFDTGLRSCEIFLISLWLALVAHICLH